jgi:hypothetical protein
MNTLFGANFATILINVSLPLFWLDPNLNVFDFLRKTVLYCTYYLTFAIYITSVMAIILAIPKARTRWCGNLKGFLHEKDG